MSSLSKLIKQGPIGLTPEFVQALEPAWRMHPSVEGAESYDFSDTQLASATMTAMMLSQPLILAGEPGVGKTSFARALSHRLKLKIHRPINVKSTLLGMSLFYHFSEISRFRDANMKANPGLLSYVTLTGLGMAIVQSAGPERRVDLGSRSAEDLFGPEAQSILEDRGHTGPDDSIALGVLFPDVFADTTKRRSIVLIDELDKAPRDAPNDVLAEIESLELHFEELDFGVTADPAHFPLVIITSNSERSFPDAFLRRCIFHWIEPPSDARLRAIAASRAAPHGVLSPNAPLVEGALTYFTEVCAKAVGKKPATAEFISFVSALVQAGYEATDNLPDGEALRRFDGILKKSRLDHPTRP